MSLNIIVILLELSPFCAIVCLYLSWSQWKSSKTPKVLNKNSIFNSLAVQYCSDYLKKPFQPTIWAFSPLIHTAYSMRWPRVKLPTKTEYLEVSDRGLVGILWPQPNGQYTHLVEQSPVVMFIANPLSFESYVLPYIEVAFQNGFRPALFLGQDSERLPKIRRPVTYPEINANQRNSDESDFAEAIEYISTKYPRASIYVVGLSYGNATLFKFLTTDVKSHYLTGVASISPAWKKEPTGLPVTIDSATQNPNSQLETKLNSSQSCNSFFKNVAQRCYTSLQVDENSRQSAGMPSEVFSRFKRLVTPMMVIYSKDDPILPAEESKRVAAMWKNSDLLIVVETSCGGHVGFLQGFRPQSWAAMLVFQYFDAVGKFKDATVNKILV